MRYGITGFSGSAQEFIEIQAEEFEAIKLAKADLSIILAIEEKFGLILENYADYERESLDLALHQMIYTGQEWAAFRRDLLRITKRIANLLAVGRLYVNQIQHDLTAIYGDKSVILRTMRDRLTEEYDSKLGYRVMEQIRNSMQHRILPVHHLDYPCIREGELLRFSLVPSIEVSRLRNDPKFKKDVLTELEGRGRFANLTLLIREYVEGLGAVHQSLRVATEGNAKAWEETLRNVARRWEQKFAKDPFWLMVTVENEAGKIIEAEDIVTELLDYWAALVSKNCILTNLSRRFVSGTASEVIG